VTPATMLHMQQQRRSGSLLRYGSPTANFYRLHTGHIPNPHIIAAYHHVMAAVLKV